jgi:hypothetical protein
MAASNVVEGSLAGGNKGQIFWASLVLASARLFRAGGLRPTIKAAAGRPHNKRANIDRLAGMVHSFAEQYICELLVPGSGDERDYFILSCWVRHTHTRVCSDDVAGFV